MLDNSFDQLPLLQVPIAPSHSPSVRHCNVGCPNKENPSSHETCTTVFDIMPTSDKGSQRVPFDMHSDPFAGGLRDTQSEILLSDSKSIYRLTSKCKFVYPYK